MDIVFATVGLLLVGWQLQQTLGPNMKVKSRVVRMTLPPATAFAFLIWAVMQPLYPLLRGTSWYPNLLLISGVSAIILMLILCSLSLEERPEYRSGTGKPPGSTATHLALLPPLRGKSADRRSKARTS